MANKLTMTICTADWKSGIDCRGCDHHSRRGYVKCAVCSVEVQEISKATDLQYARCRNHGTWGGNPIEREIRKREALAKLTENKPVKPVVEKSLIVYSK